MWTPPTSPRSPPRSPRRRAGREHTAREAGVAYAHGICTLRRITTRHSQDSSTPARSARSTTASGWASTSATVLSGVWGAEDAVAGAGAPITVRLGAFATDLPTRHQGGAIRRSTGTSFGWVTKSVSARAVATHEYRQLRRAATWSTRRAKSGCVRSCAGWSAMAAAVSSERAATLQPSPVRLQC